MYVLVFLCIFDFLYIFFLSFYPNVFYPWFPSPQRFYLPSKIENTSRLYYANAMKIPAFPNPAWNYGDRSKYECGKCTPSYGLWWWWWWWLPWQHIWQPHIENRMEMRKKTKYKKIWEIHILVTLFIFHDELWTVFQKLCYIVICPIPTQTPTCMHKRLYEHFNRKMVYWNCIGEKE